MEYIDGTDERLGMAAGLAYGLFDAWIVIWQRDRISNFIHRATVAVKHIAPMKKKAAIPLAVN